MQLAFLLKSEWRGHSETQHETQPFVALSSAELPAGYSNKIAITLTMGRRKRRKPLPYYAFKMAPDFRGRLELGRNWRIWLFFFLIPFPSFPAHVHFSLSPASPRHKEASARVGERAFLGYTQHSWSPHQKIIESANDSIF